MNYTIKIGIVILVISLVMSGIVVYFAYSEIYSYKKPIHVVISPIWNDEGFPDNGNFVQYYDDYFSPPTSYWKKGFNLSNDTDLLVDWAISDVNFVSNPVVIVAPDWFQPLFEAKANQITNTYGVEYQWY